MVLGALVHIVIPRPSPNGDLIPGVGKVSGFISQDKWRSGAIFRLFLFGVFACSFVSLKNNRMKNHLLVEYSSHPHLLPIERDLIYWSYHPSFIITLFSPYEGYLGA